MTTEIKTGQVILNAVNRDLSSLAQYVDILETELMRLRELEEAVINYALQQDDLKWADETPREVFDVLLTIINKEDS
jgi:hypothetical protein